jgi:hypothetical protein
MTEMSGVKWWPEQGPSSDINNGVAVAGWIHSALVRSAKRRPGFGGGTSRSRARHRTTTRV